VAHADIDPELDRWELMGPADGGMVHRCIQGDYPLVNVNKKRWKDPPFYSWVSQLFRLGDWAMASRASSVNVYQRVQKNSMDLSH
jgi:hypothetical protein